MSSGRRLSRSGVVAALAACALLSIGAAQAAAATFTVTNGNDIGTGSLRQAITDAEANANEPVVDLIQITFTGNINLASSLPLIDTPMTISGTGASNVNVTRDSGASGPFTFLAVLLPSGDTVTIQNLRITGARATGFAGGAVSMVGLGNLIIDSVVFSDNQSDQGGAIFYDKGFTSIRNSTLTGNDAQFGGGIEASKFGTDVGTGELVNSTINGNTATEFGGGIYVGQGEIQVQSSTIKGNTADSDDSSPSVEGGGIYNANVSATAASVANTLLADNHDGTTSPVDSQCGGDFTSFGYNLRSTDNPGECTGFTGTGDFVDADATMLGALAANGGPTPTIALLTGNPAINAGNPATPGGAFPVCPADDQRGFLRGGTAGVCDIGAFEVGATNPHPPPPTPTPTPPSQTGSPAASVPAFNLPAAIKHCKKKFRKGPKRKKCIKRAKRHALA